VRRSWTTIIITLLYCIKLASVLLFHFRTIQICHVEPGKENVIKRNCGLVLRVFVANVSRGYQRSLSETKLEDPKIAFKGAPLINTIDVAAVVTYERLVLVSGQPSVTGRGSQRECKLDCLKSESKGTANEAPTCAVPMHAPQ